MPDFEKLFGKPLHEMEYKEVLIALCAVLNSMEEHMQEMNGRTRCIPRHKVYFRIIGFVGGGFALGIIGFLLKVWLGA